MSNHSKVVFEGWLVRYGKRKLGRAFFHMRYFVLEPNLLSYYKRKPKDNMVPLRTLEIDGNCRVEDRGLKSHHGDVFCFLCIYNRKQKDHQITMGTKDMQELMAWKQKLQEVIDQQQDSTTSKHRKAFASMDFDNLGSFALSDLETPLEDEEDSSHNLGRRLTIGNGPPDSLHDWTKDTEFGGPSQTDANQVHSRKNWRLVRCQNGLRIFEELVPVDYLPRSCTRAMKAVGVVEAKCDDVFKLVMSMDLERYEWDCSFGYGSLVEEIDGHTGILYHRLQLDWCPMLVWPRDLCYVRYWRFNDDGSYVVLFQSREHPKCRPQQGYVRAHIESGGFKISALKTRNGRPRTQVQHLMQIDLKGWGVNYVPWYQQRCVLQILNSVAGLREYFSQEDGIKAVARIPKMLGAESDSNLEKKDAKPPDADKQQAQPLDQANVETFDEESDDEEDYQEPEAFIEEESIKADSDTDAKYSEDEQSEDIDISAFSGILLLDASDKGRNCWMVPEGNLFKIRSKNFPYDKSKIPGGKYLMQLAAADWFKSHSRIDHVARRRGCAAQVAAEKGLFSLVVNLQIPASTHYSMVMYFVSKHPRPGSLLQRFVDGDDEFRNNRLKLIPSVPKGSWIVRQSVGSTPCLLGKAVDCTYIHGQSYLEIDVDIGSSAVANGVLGIVCGAITTLVVDMAFLVQANTVEELPEQLVGAIRLAHIELSAADDLPDLDNADS
ncbi:Protein ENHANCED DISEASE RESISTANCE 2 [Rhynchospora pubera]|uniref:Protein ENHANCED DISEASE RESISTANCE 2 n=1 Tax=Rhynchospora pubera TaxID=906938 RepID=A0AAV8E9K6_9POAL|nr:Protein ENHANCED DISEASE RESISTANCE 2 [Rhynchospora pubera]